MPGKFGTNKHMNLAAPLAAAEFQDFAPAPNVCTGCLCPDAARERMYAHAYDNRLEFNYPVAPLCCLTQEICVVDNARVVYYDKPPFRSGPAPAPFCMLPFTCCGPPVAYSKKPKCLCLDMSPFFGENLVFAPCELFGLKSCCFVCGAPCYDSCGVPYLTGLKNSEEFATGLKAAYDKFRTGVGSDINPKELAIFAHVTDEQMLGVVADRSRKIGAPADVELMER